MEFLPIDFLDLVESGEARVVLPTTDTGSKTYGTGRLFLPAEPMSALGYPLVMSIQTNTVALRTVPSWDHLWEAAESTNAALFCDLANNDGSSRAIISWDVSGGIGLGVWKSQRVPTAGGAGDIRSVDPTFSAGSVHSIIGRNGGGKIDLTTDGVAAAQVTETGASGDSTMVAIGSRYNFLTYSAMAHIGPLAICPSRTTDAETVLLDAGLTAGWGGLELFGFFKDRGYVGTLVLPLNGDSRGYVVT